MSAPTHDEKGNWPASEGHANVESQGMDTATSERPFRWTGYLAAPELHIVSMASWHQWQLVHGQSVPQELPAASSDQEEMNPGEQRPAYDNSSTWPVDEGKEDVESLGMDKTASEGPSRWTCFLDKPELHAVSTVSWHHFHLVRGQDAS